jgi:wyosine [tRNA(Phe)-imidazoG37] synthetase (radical SAM superfamily)
MEHRRTSCRRPHCEVDPTAAAFGRPRDFLDNRYVYTVISSRAKGLSIGLNINPACHCSFACVYCEVDHNQTLPENRCDLDILATELRTTLAFVRSGAIRHDPAFRKIPADLLELRHVAISGNGEPTLCQNFPDAVDAVMHVRAMSRQFFKVVLFTNGTGLHLPEVQEGLQALTSQDEVWIKLDAGSAEFAHKVNQAHVPFEQIVTNILDLARHRPVTIQSLFPSIDGAGPSEEEIAHYTNRVTSLAKAGAQIQLVQIYSTDRPSQRTGVGHLPLKTLSSIARRVRDAAGVRAEVF